MACKSPVPMDMPAAKTALPQLISAVAKMSYAKRFHPPRVRRWSACDLKPIRRILALDRAVQQQHACSLLNSAPVLILKLAIDKNVGSPGGELTSPGFAAVRPR